MRVPTLIPKTVGDFLRSLWTASVVDLVWKAIVTVGLIALAVILGTMGILGGAIAFLLLASLLGEGIRQTYADIWNRRFEEVTI